MEDTTEQITDQVRGVLILIIMEDTHGDYFKINIYIYDLDSLNPYYNGRYSWRVKTHISLKTK